MWNPITNQSYPLRPCQMSFSFYLRCLKSVFLHLAYFWTMHYKFLTVISKREVCSVKENLHCLNQTFLVTGCNSLKAQSPLLLFPHLFLLFSFLKSNQFWPSCLEAKAYSFPKVLIPSLTFSFRCTYAAYSLKCQLLPFHQYMFLLE